MMMKSKKILFLSLLVFMGLLQELFASSFNPEALRALAEQADSSRPGDGAFFLRLSDTELTTYFGIVPDDQSKFLHMDERQKSDFIAMTPEQQESFLRRPELTKWERFKRVLGSAGSEIVSDTRKAVSDKTTALLQEKVKAIRETMSDSMNNVVDLLLETYNGDLVQCFKEMGFSKIIRNVGAVALGKDVHDPAVKKMKLRLEGAFSLLNIVENTRKSNALAESHFFTVLETIAHVQMIGKSEEEQKIIKENLKKTQEILSGKADIPIPYYRGALVAKRMLEPFIKWFRKAANALRGKGQSVEPLKPFKSLEEFAHDLGESGGVLRLVSEFLKPESAHGKAITTTLNGVKVVVTMLADGKIAVMNLVKSSKETFAAMQETIASCQDKLNATVSSLKEGVTNVVSSATDAVSSRAVAVGQAAGNVVTAVQEVTSTVAVAVRDELTGISTALAEVGADLRYSATEIIEVVRNPLTFLVAIKEEAFGFSNALVEIAREGLFGSRNSLEDVVTELEKSENTTTTTTREELSPESEALMERGLLVVVQESLTGIYEKALAAGESIGSVGKWLRSYLPGDSNRQAAEEALKTIEEEIAAKQNSAPENSVSVEKPAPVVDHPVANDTNTEEEETGIFEDAFNTTAEEAAAKLPIEAKENNHTQSPVVDTVVPKDRSLPTDGDGGRSRSDSTVSTLSQDLPFYDAPTPEQIDAKKAADAKAKATREANAKLLKEAAAKAKADARIKAEKEAKAARAAEKAGKNTVVEKASSGGGKK